MKRKGKARTPIDVVKLPLREVGTKHFVPTATRLMKTDWAQLFINDFSYRLQKISEKR
jgi:hypothetical protein